MARVGDLIGDESSQTPVGWEQKSFSSSTVNIYLQLELEFEIQIDLYDNHFANALASFNSNFESKG